MLVLFYIGKNVEIRKYNDDNYENIINRKLMNSPPYLQQGSPLSPHREFRWCQFTESV